MKNLIILFVILFVSCQKNSKISDGNMDILIANAYQSYDNEKYLEAIPYFDEIVRRDSLNPLLYFKRGNCKNFNQDLDGAIADYERTIRMNEKMMEDAFINLGLTYELKGNDSLALFFLHKADSLNHIFGLAQVHITRIKKGFQKISNP